MAERPSPLFQPDLRQAIRDLLKTQTRRVMKRQPIAIVNDWSEDAEAGQVVMYRGWPHLLTESWGRNKRAAGELTPVKLKPPHGQPGTEWYLKEPLYKLAAQEIAAYGDGQLVIERRIRTGHAHVSWKWQRDTLSSMYMPRYAARDFVVVSDVGAGRLQDCTEEDAKAEGVDKWLKWTGLCTENPRDYRLPAFAWRMALMRAWDSINAKPKPAKKNPYTGLPEKCYVSYPWENIRETRTHRGLKWYVVGNPWNFAYTFDRYERDPGRAMPK